MTRIERHNLGEMAEGLALMAAIEDDLIAKSIKRLRELYSAPSDHCVSREDLASLIGERIAHAKNTARFLDEISDTIALRHGEKTP